MGERFESATGNNGVTYGIAKLSGTTFAPFTQHLIQALDQVAHWIVDSAIRCERRSNRGARLASPRWIALTATAQRLVRIVEDLAMRPLLGFGFVGFVFLLTAFPVRAGIIVTDEVDIVARADDNRNPATGMGNTSQHVYASSEGGHDDSRGSFHTTYFPNGDVTITGSLHQGGGVDFGSVGGAAELFASLNLTSSYVITGIQVSGAAGNGPLDPSSFAYFEFDGIKSETSFGTFDSTDFSPLVGQVLTPGTYDDILSAGAFGNARTEESFEYYYASVGDVFTITLDPVVPEPGTLGLMGLGILALAAYRRRHRKVSA